LTSGTFLNVATRHNSLSARVGSKSASFPFHITDRGATSSATTAVASNAIVLPSGPTASRRPSVHRTFTSTPGDTTGSESAPSATKAHNTASW
jgi:hypothetical protein